MGDEIIPIDEKQDDVDNEIVPHNPRDPHNAHNGKQVSLVSLSLNDPEANVYKLPEVVNFITELKVNDKIVCYTYSNSNNINIFEMSTKNQQIKDGDLLIFNNDKISIYHSAHDKISLMSSHRLSSYNEVITGVSIDDNNIWIVSPHYLFHWDFEKFQLKFSYSLRFTTTYTDEDDEGDKSKNIYKKFTVIHKESLIGVKYCNEIAIFLENVHFPIRNIQLKDTDTKIEFCEVQNNDYLLAFNLPKKDEKQNIVLYNINDINKQPIDASMIFNEKKFILYEYNSESKKAFGLVDGKFSYINLLDLNWHEFFESHKEDDDLVGWNDYLGQTFKYYYNDTLAIPDMENIKSLHSPSESKNMKEIRSLFSDEYENKNIATKDINFNNQKYKWRIELKNDELGELSVYSDKEEFLCSKDLGIKFTRLNWKILNNNALALRLNYDNIIIYEYDIHNKCIKTQYFIYKKEGLIDFSGPILPMIDTKDIANLKKDNHKQYFTQLSESIVSIIEDKTHERCLAKYGPTLLSNLVKSADPKFTLMGIIPIFVLFAMK
ncbi:4235_t:CDS:2 [Rhizophagus irregularis]|nr:4235_t:CDS:2 [Rhizophagus irregularis]